jgi:hypothetical protein
MIAFYQNGTAPEGFLPTPALILEEGEGVRAEIRAMLTSNASFKDKDSEQAWEYFGGIFVRVGPAMAFRPFYKAYMKNTFQVHADDQVAHIEVRALCGSGGLGSMFDFGGNVYEGDEVIDTYREALKEFRVSDGKKYEDFSLR